MPHEITRKTYTGVIKQVNNDEHTVEAIVSDESIDRSKERILAKAYKKRLTTFKKHPVLLSSHDYSSLGSTIGKVVKIGVEDKALHATFKYFVGEGNSEADWGFKLAEKGIAAFSVGFIPHGVDDVSVDDKKAKDGEVEDVRRIFTDVELLEISQVNIPANSNALQKGLNSDDPVVKGLAEQLIKAFPEGCESKTVIPYKKYPLIDEASAWSASKAELNIRKWAGWDGESTDSIDFKKYQSAFSWVDSENAEALASYKLPHHDVDGGVVGTHWRGTVAAMTALLGGRGGTNIPDGDRRGIYNHLAKHYKDFDKEAPEFKAYTCYDDVESGCKDLTTAVALCGLFDNTEFVKTQSLLIVDEVRKHIVDLHGVFSSELTSEILKQVKNQLQEINIKATAGQDEGIGEEYIGQLLKGVEATNKVLSG